MKKVLTINFILFLLFLIGAERYAYKEIFNAYKNPINKSNKVFEKQGCSFRFKLKYACMQQFMDSNDSKSMRPINYRKSNKKPIVFFGCSFTEGAGLSDEQTLAYKISKLTNRTTYNRGKGATGTQFMYYQLNDKNIKNEVTDAEYIVYTFIWDHFFRLYNYQINPVINVLNLRYKIVNDELVEIKPVFIPFYSLFIVKKIQYYIVNKKEQTEENDFKLFNLMMKKSIEIAQKKYPHSKFVILVYPDTHNKIFPQDEVLKLNNMGFIIINVEELIGHNLNDSKYRIIDEYHPSEAAWNEIAPKLVKKLNL